jgi:hypothetical protein
MFHSRIGVTGGGVRTRIALGMGYVPDEIAGFTSAYLGLAGNIFSAIVDLRDRRRSRVSRHPCLRQ